MLNKVEKFKEAVISFKNSKQNSDDYFNLLLTSIMVTRQGSGIMFETMQEILKQIIDEETINKE